MRHHLRCLPVIVGVLTLGAVGVLLTWDVVPKRFPARSHDVLAAFPLAMIAFAWLLYQRAHRLSAGQWVKAILLAAAFLFWAANQLWPDLPPSVLFNDLAIGLFVLDVFLSIIAAPAVIEDRTIAARDQSGCPTAEETVTRESRSSSPSHKSS